MTDPTVTAALIGLIGVLAAALIAAVIRIVRNNKGKNNPGSLHDVEILLTKINGKLEALGRLEDGQKGMLGKLEELLRG